MSPRSFTVRGTRNGSLVHVTWTEGGGLAGDPPTVDLVLNQAEMVDVLRCDGIARRAFGDLASLREDPLTDPPSAYRIIVHLLDNVREVTGDVAEVAALAPSPVPDRPE